MLYKIFTEELNKDLASQ